MKQNKLNESIEKMQRLMEFHFKPNNRKDSVEPEFTPEEPVKFDEVGDKFSAQEPIQQEDANDYPTFEQYKDEVIIDEDEPVDGEEDPANVAQTPATGQLDQSQQPAPEGQPAPAMEPAPAAAPEAQPAPEPEMAPPAQEPAMPEPTVADTSAPVDSDLQVQFQQQLQKSEEILARFNEIQASLSGVQNVAATVANIAADVEEIKNPSYDAQHDMISAQSYPYNVKLSDFWGWGEEEEAEVEKPTEFKINPAEVNSYNKTDIQNSFGI